MKPLRLTPAYTAAAAAGALGAAVILFGCTTAPASNKPDAEEAQARQALEAEEAEAARQAAREAAEAALAQLNPESSSSEPSEGKRLYSFKTQSLLQVGKAAQ